MLIQWLCYFDNGKQEPWKVPVDLSTLIHAYDPCPHVAGVDRLYCEAHQELFLENRLMVRCTNVGMHYKCNQHA